MRAYRLPMGPVSFCVSFGGVLSESMLCRGLTDCWKKGASSDTGSLMQKRVTWLEVGSRVSFLLLEGLEQPCCQMPVGHSRACANANTMSKLNLTTRNICVVGSILL